MDCRTIAVAALVGSVAIGTAMAADAPAPAPAPAQSNTVCLEPSRIDHTTILNDQTILFQMVDGKVWRNDLPQKCFNLKFQGGFAYEVTGGSICSNLQTIKVLKTHNTCFLGAFTPYVAPAPAAATQQQ